MRTDRTTKALLFAIAAGLWLHLAGELLTPAAAEAQLIDDTQGRRIVTTLQAINIDTGSMRSNLDSIDRALSLHLRSIESNTAKTVDCVKALRGGFSVGC